MLHVDVVLWFESRLPGSPKCKLVIYFAADLRPMDGLNTMRLRISNSI